MTKTFHGVIRGKMIEVAEDLGMADGQAVEVRVTVVAREQNWGEGLQRSAGALAAEWTQEDDQILDEIRQSRKHDTRQDIAE